MTCATDCHRLGVNERRISVANVAGKPQKTTPFEIGTVFTSQGSGVRTPHRPPYISVIYQVFIGFPPKRPRLCANETANETRTMPDTDLEFMLGQALRPPLKAHSTSLKGNDQ